MSAERAKLTRGDFSYGDIRIVGKVGTVTVGKFCSIAGGVTAILVGHNLSLISTYPFVSREFRGMWKPDPDLWALHPVVKDVVIGNDVWIGQDAILVGGCTIGDGAVIGSGAVVAGCVLPYSVVIGNPARLLRMRFNDTIIDALLRIRWWDWPVDKIRANVSLIASDSIDTFIAMHDPESPVYRKEDK